jgi:hypothetical protein
MEIRSLIILAAKADSEGNFRVADRLTAKIETMSREAARVNFGPLAEQFLQGLGAIKINGPARLHKAAPGNSVYKGYEMPTAKVEELKKIHLNEIKAGRNSGQASPAAPGTAAPGTAVPGQTQTQQQIVNNYLNSPIPGKKGNTGNKGKDGRDGIDGAQGIQGLKGDSGPQGRAGAWWPGLVAGLLSGAIGAGGVAAWLISKGADNAVVRDMENHLGRLPQFQMMTRRTDSGDLTGAKAIRAQNFVDTNSTNPRLKNQRDWYNFALQQSGGDANFANNVISLVKATPQMPSSIGGGPNI